MTVIRTITLKFFINNTSSLPIFQSNPSFAFYNPNGFFLLQMPLENGFLTYFSLISGDRWASVLICRCPRDDRWTKRNSRLWAAGTAGTVIGGGWQPQMMPPTKRMRAFRYSDISIGWWSGHSNFELICKHNTNENGEKSLQSITT